MVDYIRDEEEQAERLKEWWQKNGTATIIVIVLAIGALLGWRQWQDHSAGQAGEASQHYEAMMTALGQQGDADLVRNAADTLIKDFGGSAYADYSPRAPDANGAGPCSADGKLASTRLRKQSGKLTAP